MLSSYIRAAGRIRGYYFHVISAGVLIATALLVISSRIIRQINVALLRDAPIELAIYAEGQIRLLTWIYIATVLILVLGSVFILLFIGQKVGGPTVAILEYITQLRAGNYEYQRKLRDGDELGEIMEQLQGLAGDLKNKSR